MPFRFDRFRFDPEEGTLSDAERQLKLTPKSAALLLFLIEHPKRLAQKDEILDAVWQHTHVTDGVLKTCVAEIRRTLGDDAAAPRIIETVHGRGYRFMADVSRETAACVATTPFVGRDAELDRLERHFREAIAGHRQLVFVTGEPGIGKSTLIGAFLERSVTDRASVARGQCIEQYGAGEPYRPFLEALGHLCRDAERFRVAELLGRYAPKWLAQMPWLLEAGDRIRLERDLLGASHERMLREILEFLEVFSAERPLVLVLEDLHWSDSSTVELLSAFARRPDPARVLVVGAYRPAELIVADHPLIALKRDLAPRRHCQEVPLDLLSRAEIDLYLSRRFPDGGLPEGLAAAIHARTDGHPLFMTSVVDYAIANGLIARAGDRWQATGDLGQIERDVPESPREMIDRQIDALAHDDGEVVRAASVAGAEFSAAAVASALGEDPVKTEERFDDLARQGRFVRGAGVARWPDGTVAGRFAFLHALHRDVVYQRVGEARRQRLHQRIGERVELAYGDRAGEIAAELALHFERGGDACRAVQYLGQAGANAVRRSAHPQAVEHLRRALELLKAMPDTPERARRELALQVALGGPLSTTQGFASPEVGRCWARARELCDQVGETPQLFPALMGMRSFHTVRGELGTARDLGEQVLRLAEISGEPPLRVQARYAIGLPLYLLGELSSAREYAEQGIALFDLHEHRTQALIYGQDAGVGCLALAARALWLLGYPDQAARRSEDAIRAARELAHLPTLSFALLFAATAEPFPGDVLRVEERAAEAITLSREHGFPFFLAGGLVARGWAQSAQGCAQEGVADLQEGLAFWRLIGCRFLEPYYLSMLAEANRQAGRGEEALAALNEAFAVVEETGERWCEAELHRLRAELFLESSPAEAEAHLERAAVIARAQQAKSLELRALTRLARIWHGRGQTERARTTLAEVHGWFTEGFDTPDLKTAKALLEEMSVAGNE